MKKVLAFVAAAITLASCTRDEQSWQTLTYEGPATLYGHGACDIRYWADHTLNSTHLWVELDTNGVSFLMGGLVDSIKSVDATSDLHNRREYSFLESNTLIGMRHEQYKKITIRLRLYTKEADTLVLDFLP